MVQRTIKKCKKTEIMTNLFLIYVNPIGKNSNDEYEYEFFFSEDPETVWQDSWNVLAPSTCGDIRPDETMYSVVKRLVTEIPFFCAQQNSCFSMGDCKEGVICLAHENINDYTEYPEPYRIVFHYGEDMASVIEKLHGRDQHFKED